MPSWSIMFRWSSAAVQFCGGGRLPGNCWPARTLTIKSGMTHRFAARILVCYRLVWDFCATGVVVGLNEGEDEEPGSGSLAFRSHCFSALAGGINARAA